MTHILFILHLILTHLAKTLSQVALFFTVPMIAREHLAENYHTTYQLEPNQMYVKICTLVAVFLAMYAVIRQVSNLSNND